MRRGAGACGVVCAESTDGAAWHNASRDVGRSAQGAHYLIADARPLQSREQATHSHSHARVLLFVTTAAFARMHAGRRT